MWTYLPPGPTDDYTLVLFDGGDARQLRVLSAFDAAAHPPRAVLAIDHGSPQGRAADLCCNPAFRDDVLRLAAAPVVAAGCSFGGLAATYFALSAPDQVLGAVGLSPSYWWQDARGRGVLDFDTGAPTRLVLAAGALEWMILPEFAAAACALRARGHQVVARRFVGGHDWVQWREELPAGVAGLVA